MNGPDAETALWTSKPVSLEELSLHRRSISLDEAVVATMLPGLAGLPVAADPVVRDHLFE